MASDLELAKSLVPDILLAGKAIMKIYHHQTEFKVKQDGSPVTKADLIAERILLSALKRLKNDVPIVSEENTQSHAMKTPKSFFLVDPLDGTKEFLKADNRGAFTVNIGLVKDEVPVMGVVYAPALDHFFLVLRMQVRLKCAVIFAARLKSGSRLQTV